MTKSKESKEGSGEVGVSAAGSRLLKVKKEIGEDMKKKEKKRAATEAVATRVSKRHKKSAPSGSHFPSSMKGQEVVNTMTQAYGKKELARLCTAEETPEDAPEGWFCIPEKFISRCHLRFPLPTLLLDLLDHYELALSQLCPLVIRTINGFITRSTEEGLSVELADLMSLFSLKESSSKDGGSGTYYLSARPSLGIFKFSSSDDDWRKKYFYVKVDPSTVPEGRTLRTIWSYDISG